MKQQSSKLVAAELPEPARVAWDAIAEREHLSKKAAMARALCAYNAISAQLERSGHGARVVVTDRNGTQLREVQI